MATSIISKSDNWKQRVGDKFFYFKDIFCNPDPKLNQEMPPLRMSWEWCEKSGFTNISFGLVNGINGKLSYEDLKNFKKIQILVKWVPIEDVGMGQKIEIGNLLNSGNLVSKPNFSVTPDVINEDVLKRQLGYKIIPGKSNVNNIYHRADG